MRRISFVVAMVLMIGNQVSAQTADREIPSMSANIEMTEDAVAVDPADSEMYRKIQKKLSAKTAGHKQRSPQSDELATLSAE